MSPVIIANLLGLVGYLVLLLATQKHAKRGFLAIDAAGSFLVGAQYLLLGVVSAALLNVVFVLADTLNLLPEKWRKVYPVFYPLTLLVSVINWSGLINVFVGLAGLLALAGRQQKQMVRLRWLMIGMAISFFVVGVLAGSWAQMIFSVFYVGANLRQLFFVHPAPAPAR